MSKASNDVLAERQRQIDVEGFGPQHDDEHELCELADAAACYALTQCSPTEAIPEYWPWPWDVKWWKPKTHRENLVRAGALIIAEIERLDRKDSQP